MNLLDCYVIKVFGKPEYGHFCEVEWWTVEVEYRDGWSPSPRPHTLVFGSLAQAESVKEGFHFLA